MSSREVLADINLPNIGLVDKILANGYLESHEGYKWHGCYRLVLTRAEMDAVLNGLATPKKC